MIAELNFNKKHTLTLPELMDVACQYSWVSTILNCIGTTRPSVQESQKKKSENQFGFIKQCAPIINVEQPGITGLKPGQRNECYSQDIQQKQGRRETGSLR